MQPATGGVGERQPARILIVDDHEISRAALRALLRTEGIDVADVRTGDAAITAAIAFRPDVAIVDVTPADPAGFLVAQRLQALPEAPVVLLTSSASRSRFDSQLERHLFVAKADLCARAIEERAGTSSDDRARRGPTLSAHQPLKGSNDATATGHNPAPPTPEATGRSAYP